MGNENGSNSDSSLPPMPENNDNGNPTDNGTGNSKFKKVLRITWHITRNYLWPVLFTVTKYTLIVLWWLLKQLWRFTSKVAYPLIKAGYYKLPKKQRIPVTLLTVIVIGFGCTVLAVGGIPGLNFGLNRNSERPAASALAADSELKLLNGSWEEQKESAKMILKQAGFDIVLDDAVPRAAVPFVIGPELTLLTYDANRKPEGGGRLTLEQFAEMMRDFDFPFASGEDPAALLQSGIRHWVRHA
ncbi:hypothetical protein ACX1C1_13445 [Paenibacillus sp. strain BS8-2]